MNMQIVVRSLCVTLLAAGVVAAASPTRAQVGPHAAEAAQILKADADFAAAVSQRNREGFLAFIPDVTTFNGGSASELHGREAVMKDWGDFFQPGGPTLSWAPTSGAVIGAGDLGYTTGRSIYRSKDPSGAAIERQGEYLTVWRKQRDGTWKVIFDTGSTLPPAR